MGPVYIATGCDSNFVGLTCAMLASLEEKGELPEAKIIVTAFGLSQEDKDDLRLAAGALGDQMRFLELGEDSALVPEVPKFDFPFPTIGCLVAPKGVNERRARMLMLDSDMIINASLRPLFELDLAGFAIGAVKNMLVERELHARGRVLDDDYFNTGTLLVDVDQWHAKDLGNAAMRWLAAQPDTPVWPDQDALNHVVGPNWLRLDRTWNFAYAGEDRQFFYEEFAAANIIHFSGAKPTEARNHPAVPFYDRQVERIRVRKAWGQPDAAPTDRHFLATSYEVLLGRELEEPMLVPQRIHLRPSEVIGNLVSSQEFKDQVIEPLRNGRRLASNRWPGHPRLGSSELVGGQAASYLRRSATRRKRGDMA